MLRSSLLALTALLSLLLPGAAAAQTTAIRIMPPERAVFAVGQRFDIRVEATGGNPAGAPPAGLQVRLNGENITERNLLDPGVGGERGAGGTGATARELPAHWRAHAAPAHTTNFLVRELSFDAPGRYLLEATTADGASAAVTLEVEGWAANGLPGATAGAPEENLTPVRNIIFLLGDGMGTAQRTAARIVSRGVSGGKADGLLAMDRMEVTGQAMTFSLNSVITDSAPGMAAYSSGHKSSNNQLGVYPDNTVDDAFDNPRVEYIGEVLRRVRGPGFQVGLVTTADITDATPAGNAAHTADRNDGPRIAVQYLEERDRNGISVLLGGGRRHFVPRAEHPLGRRDERPLGTEFEAAGFTPLGTATELRSLLESPEVPARLLGLFHPSHMPVSFDKVGAGRYSDELENARHDGLRDQPMLDEMTALALRTLEAHATGGFYLMVEGASIDKQAHAVDAERTIWDVIEFDNAVAVALEFAARTPNTLVIVAADHETGGLAPIGVGNERYAPGLLGRAERDYAAVFRFDRDQELNFFPNYETDEKGFPLHPDPSRKLLMGWAAAPDRYENWLSNRRAQEGAIVLETPPAEGAPEGTLPLRTAVANPARSGPEPTSDNRSVEGVPIPGFLVPGVIERRSIPCPAADGCPADTIASPLTIAGHTGSDVPVSAHGPGAWQFTGTYDNTAVFLKMLRAAGGLGGGFGGR